MIDVVYVATSNKLGETISSIRSLLRHPPFPDRITLITDKSEGFSIPGCPIPIQLKKLEPIIERRPLGNKIRACESDSDVVIYLDNDTFLNGSVCSLIDTEASDWDIRGRVASIFVNGKIRHDIWEEFFDSCGLIPVPMWNTGVLCINSRLRIELRAAWAKWFIELSKINYSHICEPFGMDQFALSLAVAELGLRSDNLNSCEHSFEWEHENPFHSTVHHTSSNFYRRASIRHRLANLPGCQSWAPEILVSTENLTRRFIRLIK